MKSIILIVKPNEAANILNGRQTIIIKKSAPKETPFKVYLYCTKDKRGKIGRPRHIKNVAIWSKNFCPPGFISAGGKVVAEFVCDKVDEIKVIGDTLYSANNIFANKLKNMCLSIKELKEYLGNKNGVAIGIPELKVYDKPKELGEFCAEKKHKVYGNLSASKPFMEIRRNEQITRPPQSWQYCEELD